MRQVSIAFALIALASGCDKKDDKGTAAAQAATPPPTASAIPASANAKTFAVDPDGKVSIDMPAPKEHIKATAGNSAGDLSIDLGNLASTRGTVKVDLTTLKTATFDAPDKNATQTEHAVTWLEVGPKASPEDQARNKFIVFTVQSIDGLSATDLSKVAPTKDGADDVRTVTAKVKGEVFLHGKKSQRQADVSVSFRGAPDKPTRVDIKTTSPFKIVLADHDVKPRDNFGKLAQGAFNLLGTKVADEASVDFQLSAKPK
jgi:hypothetical protein